MRFWAVLALAAASLLAACNRAPTAPARYVIGQPYALGGLWSYPREDFALNDTGLAAIIPDTRSGRATANGEVYDPSALMAAHRTLQMPAILRVTNLEAGRELLVRVNDRGPAAPGRVLGLSRRAAELLGARDGTQLRIVVEAEPSRALASGLPQTETPQLAIAAAPAGSVARETLAPPPGARAATQLREGRAAPVLAAAAATTAAPTIALPMQATVVAAQPGRLWVQAGNFTNRDAAQRQAARIGGARAEAFGPGRRPEFRVRVGPMQTAAEADAALARVLRAGISEARIVVD
ncbi:septal ring lytic transglycosylase RlpA family protein [Humitalea sp. 24SJ18S-53]|uniref:septal ring lytic transglycosylase RlpA family protein n=1 Tax=Humitalea sp. 24SJ18S-53 TaxID=3422307 RepID=UPI003D6664E3